MIEPCELSENLNNWRLKLDGNENPYGASNMALGAIKNMNLEDISLKANPKKIIDRLADLYSLNAKNLFLANSRDEILRLLFDIYLQKGTLAIYEPAVLKPLSGLAAENRLEYIKKNIDLNLCDFSKTKMVYLATPNETDGSIVRAGALKSSAQNFPNTLFVVDCSYIAFSGETVLGDYLDLIKELKNVIVIKSFDYDYALLGLGVTFAAGNKENIFEISMQSSGNLNRASLIALNASLNDKRHFESIYELNQKAKEAFFEGLLNSGFRPFKSEANFILCDFSAYCDFYYSKLKNNGVLAKIFNENPRYSSCMRITVPKIGGVKYILELLKKKDVLIFNLDESLKNPDEPPFGKETMDILSKKYDFVFYSLTLDERQGIEILKKTGLENYFCGCRFDKDLKSDLLGEIKEQCRYKKIAFLTDNTQGAIAANKAGIEVLGVVGDYCDINYLCNNFRHFGVRHILNDLSEIENFLKTVFTNTTVD